MKSYIPQAAVSQEVTQLKLDWYYVSLRGTRAQLEAIESRIGELASIGREQAEGERETNDWVASMDSMPYYA